MNTMVKSKLRKLILLGVPVLLIATLVLAGCASNDPWTDDMYVEGELYVWYNDDWQQVTGGGASQLSDLSDVGSIDYGVGKYLRADGTLYSSANLSIFDDPSPSLSTDIDINDYSVVNLGKIIFKEFTELTLDSAGSITVEYSSHSVDTYENASSDDLVTIEGGESGQLLFLHPAASTRTVVVKHMAGAGNIFIQGESDLLLDAITSGVFLMCISTVPPATIWVDVTEVSGFSRSATIVVAASNALDPSNADYRCDGTADQVEINYAIDDLTNGGIVFLSDGIFTCDDSIEMEDYVTLQGTGDGTVLTFDDDVADGIGLIEDTCTDGHITLTNFQMDGNGASQVVGDQSGICLTDVDWSVIQGLYIHSFTEHGIYVTGMDDSIVQTNRLMAMADSGAYLNGCNRVVFKDNIIDGTGYPEIGIQHGAYFYNSDYCALSGNIVSNLRDNGLYFEYGCDHNSLVRNTIKGVTGAGCYFYGGMFGSPCNYNELALNIITDCSNRGIYFISDVSYGTIEGNHLYNCTGGIGLHGFTGDADNNLITNNNIVGDNSQGLYIAAASVVNTMIEGNMLCAGRGASDYVDLGTNTRFIDNCGYVDATHVCDWLPDDEGVSPSLPGPTESYDLRVIGGNAQLATHRIGYSEIDLSDDAVAQTVALEVAGKYGIDSVSWDSLSIILYEGQDLGEALRYMEGLGFGEGSVATSYLIPDSQEWIDAGLRTDREALEGRMSGRGVALWYMENPDAKVWTHEDLKILVEEELSVHAHWARVEGFDIHSEKPLRVTRLWHGQEISANCYVTERIAEAYPGDLEIGDIVLVEFVGGDIDKLLAIEKIYKSW